MPKDEIFEFLFLSRKRVYFFVKEEFVKLCDLFVCKLFVAVIDLIGGS